MAKRKIEIDPSNKHVQMYGTYRFCTELTGDHTLSRVSRRKDFPDVLSRHRSEASITDAIANYNAEVDAEIEKIRAQYR